MTFHGFSWQFEDLEKKQRWEAGALAISERTVAWQNSTAARHEAWIVVSYLFIYYDISNIYHI